jgi:hypothetical protein
MYQRRGKETGCDDDRLKTILCSRTNVERFREVCACTGQAQRWS